MEFLNIQLYPEEVINGSSDKITTLGLFLTSDLGCSSTTLDEWIFDDDQED